MTDDSSSEDGSPERKKRYKILRELGRGGMGVVFHAIQTETGRPVALKLIRAELLRKQKTVQRVRREVRALAKLQHPNLVNLYDYRMRGKSHYLAMEYVDGPDLRSHVEANGAQSRDVILRLGSDIASAMLYFHGQGIIHRDLKPRNILLMSDGTAKISDFGLSKHLDLSTITDLGVQVGTPRYMSPEIVQAEEVDHRSDIYQLGLILYFVATGQPAHRGDSVKDVMRCCLSADYPRPRELNAAPDEHLEALILRCMAMRPDDRFPHAGAVLKPLAHLERRSRAMERRRRGTSSTTTTRRTMTTPPRPRPSCRRPSTGSTSTVSCPVAVPPAEPSERGAWKGSAVPKPVLPRARSRGHGSCRSPC